jgi:hypothetical protein
MITPAYSPTATERVLPRMALDFTTASLDSRVTVTRALNTATRINSSGVIETVNANLPRFDYSLGSGGACKGLLIEEARTNSLTGVDCVNPTATTGWTAFGDAAGVFSVVDDTAALTSAGLAGICSSGKVFRMDNSAGATPFYARFNNTITIGVATWTYSAYARGSGVFTFQNNSGTWSGTTSPAISSQYQRLTSTGVGSTSPTNFRIKADAGSVLYFILAQAEEGAFVTSVIPNTGSSVTRNADAVSMTGTNFSSWYNQSEGAIVCSVSGGKNSVWAVSYDMGTTGNLAYVRQTSPTAVSSVINGAGSSGTSITADTAYTTALAYKINDCAFAINGGQLSTFAGTPGTATDLIIGSLNGSFILNGHVKKLMFYPQRLTNAECVAFSK